MKIHFHDPSVQNWFGLPSRRTTCGRVVMDEAVLEDVLKHRKGQRYGVSPIVSRRRTTKTVSSVTCEVCLKALGKL